MTHILHKHSTKERAEKEAVKVRKLLRVRKDQVLVRKVGEMYGTFLV